jgi:hypothetical protein
MHVEIMSILKSGNMIQNLLFSILLSKNIKIKTYRTIGAKLGLLLHRKHKLRVLENRASEGGRTGQWRKLHNKKLCVL